ncbi:zinc finger, AN1-type domain [Coemansia sp. RSA 1933]|nr:zinc finger, AN1-type domain [Coemansia sp. RSA 1933]
MEFPDLGKNCSLDECNKLDYLAVECPYCKHFFCDDHWRTQKHNCAKKHLVKDRQVPACPICGEIIATNPDEQPDVVIDRHIEAGCTRKSKLSSKKGSSSGGGCAAKGCTTKTHAWTICDSCTNRYCLKHRYPDVHDCQPMRASSLPSSFTKGIGSLIGSSSITTPKYRAASTTPSVAASRAASGATKKDAPAKFKDSGCIIA